MGLVASEARSVVQRATRDNNIAVVIERVEALPAGLRVLIHDRYGPLPALEIRTADDCAVALEQLNSDCLEICAIVRARHQIASRIPASRFLPPTHFGFDALVGLVILGSDSILLRAPDYVTGYARLRAYVNRIQTPNAAPGRL